MIYQENIVKNAKVESAILWKRLREAEEDVRRAQKFLDECLATRKKLEDQISNLKYFLVMAGAGSPKFE